MGGRWYWYVCCAPGCDFQTDFATRSQSHCEYSGHTDHMVAVNPPGPGERFITVDEVRANYVHEPSAVSNEPLSTKPRGRSAASVAVFG